MAIKILIGGSPCTYWSIAQTNNRETKAEGMGWELFKNYLIAKEKFKPDFFLYENNKSAAQAIKDQIAEEFGVGVDPDVRFTYINSALVSAQNRQRFYVTNFGDIEQPEDRGVLLKDILETGVTDRDKSHAVISSAGRTTTREYFDKQQGTMSFEPVGGMELTHTCDYEVTDQNTLRIGYTDPSESQGYRVYSTEHKCVCLRGQGNGRGGELIAEPIRIPEYGNTGKSRPVRASYAYKGSGEGSLKSEAFPDNPNKQASDYVAEPLNITPDGKSQTLKASPSSAVSSMFRTGTFGITGVAEPISVGNMYPNKGQNGQLFSVDGKSKTLSAGTGKSGGGIGSNNSPKVVIPVMEADTVQKAIPDLVEKYGCVPEMFNAYNRAEITDKSPTLSTGSMVTSSCATNRFESIFGYAIPCEWDENGRPTKAISSADGKTYTVYEVKDGIITIKDKQYPIKLADGYYIIRKLTVKECARLQTMPDDYCKAVSDSQAYKALGNGWTAEVIIHLLNHALKDVPRDEEIVVLSMYDGIATGRYCLDKMGFTNVTYHAYEIDKYPIQVAMDNYPDIIQHGDAFAVREDDWKPPQTRSEWLDELLGGV